MAIALDTSTNGGFSESGTTLTFSHTCTTSDNRILFVAVRTGTAEGDNISTVTYGAVSCTKVGSSVLENSLNSYVSLWYLIAPKTGANNIVCTLQGSGYVTADSASYYGVKQSSQPNANSSKQQDNSATITVTVNTITDNCWTVASVSDPVTTSASSGCTKRQEQLFDSGAAISPPANHDMVIGGGDSSTDWAAVIASFEPYEVSTDDTVGYFNV